MTEGLQIVSNQTSGVSHKTQYSQTIICTYKKCCVSKYTEPIIVGLIVAEISQQLAYSEEFSQQHNEILVMSKYPASTSSAPPLAHFKPVGRLTGWK